MAGDALLFVLTGMDMGKSPLPGAPSSKSPPRCYFQGSPSKDGRRDFPLHFIPAGGGILPPWLPVNQITVADSLLLHGHTSLPHRAPPKRHKTSSHSITPDRRAPVSGYLTKTKGTFPVRERPLFFYQLFTVPPSRLMECMRERPGIGRKAPFLRQATGLPSNISLLRRGRHDGIAVQLPGQRAVDGDQGHGEDDGHLDQTGPKLFRQDAGAHEAQGPV